MDFGGRIKLLREEKWLTQEELAKQLNVTKAAISRYEVGRRQPSLEIMIHIADFFDVSLDWLLGRSSIRNFTSVNRKTYEDLEKIMKLINNLKK